MTLLKKNLEALKKNNPDLAKKAESTEIPGNIRINRSKSGFPVLKLDGLHLNSPYDPIKEAKNWISRHSCEIEDGEPVVLLGLGLGYHLLELLKHTERKVFVVEPNMEIFRAAIEYVNMGSCLSRVKFFINKDIDKLYEEIPFKYLKYREKYNINILKHTPSLKSNNEYFDSFLKRFEALKRSSNLRLKILVISPIFGGSYPISKYCVSALKRLGHNVDFLDNSPYYKTFKSLENITDEKNNVAQLRSIYINLLSEVIFARAIQVKPDFIFALAQSPLTLELPKRLRELNIPLAYWFVEDFREMSYWREIAPLCDFFFTIQRGEFFRNLKEIGVSNFYYLPLACDPEFHKKVFLTTEEEKERYKCDISFVGAGYYNRRNSFLRLLDFNFKIWGSEWDLSSPLSKNIQNQGRRIEPEEYNKIFNSSKINLNLHSSTYHQGVNHFGDFVNPRTFEIASSGGFQLVDYRSELHKFFKIGEEIICYRDADELREKIEYYLKHPKKREEIARKGQQRALQEHTYENRMKEMIAFVLERSSDRLIKDNRFNGNNLEKLIKEAGRNSELVNFLSEFKDTREIELKEIVKEIKKGEGELTKVENIFLLMDSFVH